MKKVMTIVLSVSFSIAAAQWKDTGNNFEDSMHMPVSTAPASQRNPITLTSYPDGGYFVIWEDDRNFSTTKTDIYAQKYDKDGNRLWAADGVPVVNGPNGQHYTFNSNQDYRNRSFAATDSAGGFYITYSDDSLSTYYWERLTVQHIRSNGTRVFPDIGYIIARSVYPNLNMAGQLIADGNKGFFITYRNIGGRDYVLSYCYKEENGTMKYYGGGVMNENALQTSSIGQCGIKTDVTYPGTTVSDFNVWSDGDGGCNVIISMASNTVEQGTMLAYNRLWRAKKDSRAKTLFRNSSGTACPRTTEYDQGDVYRMYYVVKDFQSVACGGGGGPIYTYTNYRLLANGYQLIDQFKYDYVFPKGVSLSTGGNINIDMIAVTRRVLINNAWTNYVVHGYAYPAEKFDSIPYQRSSFSNPEIGYNPVAPLQMNYLQLFRDTLLGSPSAQYAADFSLAAGGNHIYATALMGSGARKVLLQHLQLKQNGPDSFALEYKTNSSSTPEKNGVAIGAEANTGFGGFNIFYDHPLVTVAKNGRAIFYIREYYRSARISPIGTNVQLKWGAMGRPISTGVYNGFYNLEQPVATLDSTGSNSFMAWRDNKAIPGNSGDNIFMRQVSKLDVLNHRPPAKSVKPLYYFSSETYANPCIMYGTSNEFTPLEVYNSYNGIGTSPVLEILDNNYLGYVQARVFQHVGPIRKYNNEAYLNRNYTIKPDSLPPGAEFDLLLYFTTAEFNALKNTDNIIADPGYLMVVRQPNSTASAPAAYIPVAGEELITPVFWYPVDGGYILKIVGKGLGNFFIRKITTTSLCIASATSFSSNITGATYQWQVNTGSGFGNISNNTNYSGTNTATLQLTNIPSSFSGNLYRCEVNSLNVSNTFYLQVSNTWTGAVNNLWETAGNWNCNTVPDANTDVIINSGTVTVNSNTACRSIKMNPGASLNVTGGFKLTVTH